MKTIKIYDSLEVETLSKYNYEVYTLMYNLEDWFGLILKLDGLLQWENPRHSLLCIFVISVVFMSIYVYDPPFLLTIGILGLILGFVDYFGPLLSLRMSTNFSRSEAKLRYCSFCRRLVEFKHGITEFFDFIYQLRSKHPTIHFMTCASLLLITVFIGHQISDLLLMYLFTLAFFIIPKLQPIRIFKLIAYVTCYPFLFIRSGIWYLWSLVPDFRGIFKGLFTKRFRQNTD